MSGFMGAVFSLSAARVVLTNHTLNAIDSEITSPAASAVARFRLNADGTAQAVMTGNGSSPAAPGGVYSGEWLQGSSNGSNYQALATLNSGTLASGTVGSWIDCSTAPSWSCSATRSTVGGATQTANLTIQIRNKTTLAVLASAVIVLYAEANFDA